MFLKKTQKLAELRIKQSILEEEIHEPWRKQVLKNTDRQEVSERLAIPDNDSKEADDSISTKKPD